MNEFNVEILADGTVKITTGPFSPAVHDNAQAFIDSVTRLLGAQEDTSRVRRGMHHHHNHEHNEQHNH